MARVEGVADWLLAPEPVRQLPESRRVLLLGDRGASRRPTAQPPENDHRSAPHAAGFKRSPCVGYMVDAIFARHPQTNVAGLDDIAESVYPAALSADREQIARVLDLLMAGLRTPR